uniref:Ricin B lectin domain-containing protein n=1 Tax=Echeneis naucrates TaxID=173247 RepID=A0A665SX41_ECHNA
IRVVARTIGFCVCVSSKASSGFKIQNKLMGKCLQVQEGILGGTVSLGECDPYSSLQEWHWLPQSHALSSRHTGECLSAPGEQYEGVLLQPCISGAWTCSKKGHLTLMGRALHLSAAPESTLIFLSQNNKQVMRIPEIGLLDQMFIYVHTVCVCTGVGWKITMLILSSLALVLGTVILILNVYSNRKKVVCVLKSYTVKPDASAPGSPVPSERAPLTEHAMRLPHSSPTLHRGEILIEWKDGSVTPLNVVSGLSVFA